MPAMRHGVRIVAVRHGPAFDRDPMRWPDDARRPLTPTGAAQTRRAVKGLARYVGKVDRIVTSGAVRCRATTNLLRAALKEPPGVEVWRELAPGQLAPPVIRRLARTTRSGQQVVLVGHDPTLTELLGLALIGEGTPFVRMGKGAAVCLEFPRGVRPGAGVLRWLATRKQLSRAGK
jgi:phosphohistidine phosphatase